MPNDRGRRKLPQSPTPPTIPTTPEVADVLPIGRRAVSRTEVGEMTSAANEPPPVRCIAQPLPEVLKVAEVAALLRCDRKTVYSLVRRRRIPSAKRIGRGIRFSKQAILNWLADAESSH